MLTANIKSWKTTIAGICAFILAIIEGYNALETGSPFNSTMLMEALVGVGLLAAKDGDKTSEDVGTK